MDELMDGEPRPLRPIGASPEEVAARTGRLLAPLTAHPGVQVFSGVLVDAGQIPIAHAVGAGRLFLLVESVAWPAGTYSTTPDGGVLCDGAYIGQTIRPLLRAVRRLRRMTPRDHRVGAIVVVYPSLPVAPRLPERGPAGLSWLPPAGLRAHLERLLTASTYCLHDNKSVTLSQNPNTPGS